MVTCRQLLELDVLRNVRLIAGRRGLDKGVSWPYAKHTKTITPWVHGGEFLLVSGYEYGTDEGELLQLIDEAVLNQLSGLLVEGGINFKKLPEQVIRKADEADLPLFFCSGVVSFLDITRDVSTLIMESTYIARKDHSLLDQLLVSNSLTRPEIARLFEHAGISPDRCFMCAVFSIPNEEVSHIHNARIDENVMLCFSKNLKKQTKVLFEELGLEEICKVNLKTVDYLLYSEDEAGLYPIMDSLKKIRAYLDAQEKRSVYLSFSSVLSDVIQVRAGFDEAHFTASLLQQHLLPGSAAFFPDIGSYQLMLYVEDRKKLVLFRDHYLKGLYEADLGGSSQLMETLRTYLEKNGNMLRTAEALYIHRNTLQYRLDRVKAITHFDLDDSSVRRDILIAYMIMNVVPFS